MKYLVRLDDACPYMDKKKWNQVEVILNRYGIKPMVGIIPNNEDPVTMVAPLDVEFWIKAQEWGKKGWTIALHGYNHCYATECGGINPIHKRSDFAGLPFEEQKEKIERGYQILLQNGLNPTYFFFFFYTYDSNTIKALKDVTSIRLLSDTMARWPYKFDKNFVIVPCQMGRFRNIPLNGYWTFCFHPNTMNDDAIFKFEKFIVSNKEKFISFDDIPLDKVGNKKMIDKLLNFAYLSLRKIKK